MSWKKPAPFNGGALVQPFQFSPEDRAELSRYLGGDRPELIHEVEEWIAVYLAHVEHADPTPGQIRNAVRRVDREAARFLDGAASDLRRVLFEVDEITLERLVLATYSESGRNGVLDAVRQPGGPAADADVQALRAACARVLRELPAGGGRPRNRHVDFLTDRVVEVLRRHGVDTKVWFWESAARRGKTKSKDHRGGQAVGVLAIVLRAAGVKALPHTAFRLAREARPEP